jgi:hypothetical protein
MMSIFVGGTGRCGTTILKRALLRHPAVSGLRGELRIITDPDGLLDLFSVLTDRWEPFRADAAIHRFLEVAIEAAHPSSPFGRYPNHNLDAWTGGGWFMQAARRLVRALSKHENEPGGWAGGYASWMSMYEAGPLGVEEAAGPIRQFVDGIFARAHPDLTHWVDDTPAYALCADELGRIWGDRMVLVQVVRDPRDTVSSMCAVHRKAVANPKGRPWLSDSAVRNAERVAAMAARMTGPALQVRLETVVKDPDRALREVLRFCGLEPGPSVADLITQKAAHVGRWRDDPLIDREVLKILEPAVMAWNY